MHIGCPHVTRSIALALFQIITIAALIGQEVRDPSENGIELGFGIRLFNHGIFGDAVGPATDLVAGQPGNADLHFGYSRRIGPYWSLAICGSRTGVPYAFAFTSAPLYDAQGKVIFDGGRAKNISNSLDQWAGQIEARRLLWASGRWRLDLFGGLCAMWMPSVQREVGSFGSSPEPVGNLLWVVNTEYTGKVRGGGVIGTGMEFRFRRLGQLRLIVSRSMVPTPTYVGTFRIAPDTSQETRAALEQPSSNWLIGIRYVFRWGPPGPGRGQANDDAED